jgi:hypothetical protein
MQVRLPSIFRGGGSAHSIGMPGHQYEADTPPASLCVPLARRPTSTVLNYARPTVIRAGKRNKARLRGTCGCGIDGDAGACGKLTINDTHYRAAINYVSRLLRRAHRRARNGQMRTQSVSTFQPQLLGSRIICWGPSVQLATATAHGAMHCVTAGRITETTSACA